CRAPARRRSGWPVRRSARLRWSERCRSRRLTVPSVGSVADLDLLARTAALVAIPSVSHDEAAITDHLETTLRALPHLEVERVGANLVARTQLGRPTRL